MTHFNLLTDNHVDDASPAQVQHVPDPDHDGRADAQRTDHVHVAQVGEHRVVERPEREHRYDGAQRKQEHGYQEIGVRNAVAGTARSAHVLGYVHPVPHVVGLHFKRILERRQFGRDPCETDGTRPRVHIFVRKRSVPPLASRLLSIFIVLFFFPRYVYQWFTAHANTETRTPREGKQAKQRVAINNRVYERLGTGSRSIRTDRGRYGPFRVPPWS